MHLPESWLATTALAILAGTLMVGAATAYCRLADKNTPVDIGLLHGGAGAAATLLLLAAVLSGSETGQGARAALGLLALALLGGATLYFLIRRKGLLPKSVLFLHGGLAAGAVLTLLFGPPL